MNGDPIAFRAATPDDADALAALINIAGEGLPHYLWTRMADPGADPWDVGRARARRDEGGFSYRNALLVETGGRIAGCLIGYPLPPEPEPMNPDEIPPMFVPLQELENLAPNTWYLNVVAVYPEYRGRGIGSRLLEAADAAARAADRPGVSLIVADSNTSARALYASRGYREIARRPVVAEQWQTDAREWVLMVRRI